MSRSNIADAEKKTHFGYLTIPEKEKVEWVSRHFTCVARRYDYMNTLLSLGIHYQAKQSVHVIIPAGNAGMIT